MRLGFEIKMQLVEKNLNFKSMIACLMAGMVVFCSSGCGKSEAEKQRDAGREKFKITVAAIQVRTKGATYSEFRQAELDLKTSYEVNKSYLEDVATKIDSLTELLSGTDYFWSKNIKDYPLDPRNKQDLYYAQLLKPETSVASKVDFSYEQRVHDPDFAPINYVRRGLKKIDDLSAEISNQLNSSHPK